MSGFALDEAALATRDRKRQSASNFRVWAFSLSAGLVFAIIASILGAILWKGVPALSWEFLSTGPREGMTEGGIWPMLRGSILLMIGTLILTLPIGVLGGVWLAEYAGGGRFAGIMRAAVMTLAGTPSIIFGLFGLAIFVLKWKLGTSLLAGWLTLAMFSIPVVVLTTEQALKALPGELEDGAIALGLSKWQTIWKVLLPSAVPGIMTGLVLTVARAAGEAPPILLTAGIYFSTAKLNLDFEALRKPVANLPYHLAEGYRQGGVIPEKIIWGTCLVLMLFVVSVNLFSVIVRSRVRRKQRW